MRIPYWSWSSSFSVWITAVCPRPPKLSIPSAFLNPSSTPSDLIRAINSAKLAFPNVKHIQDKRLRECNYGDLDGQDKSLVIYEEHIEKPFPNGESLKDVERRIDDFIKFLKDNYHGKKVGIVAHRAPQLAFEVLTKNISWEEANRNDWRKAKAWQPGWEYIIK